MMDFIPISSGYQRLIISGILMNTFLDIRKQMLCGRNKGNKWTKLW